MGTVEFLDTQSRSETKTLATTLQFVCFYYLVLWATTELWHLILGPRNPFLYIILQTRRSIKKKDITLGINISEIEV